MRTGGKLAEFYVDPPVLEQFASLSDGRKSQYDTLHTQLADAHIGSDSFGHIPMVGSRIYEAYDEHVQACTEGVQSAADSMAAIATALRGVVANYTGADTSGRTDMQVINDTMGDITITSPGS